MGKSDPPRIILIIEDDPNTASLVAAYAQKEGFSPLIAHDGDAGLHMALHRNPQLVILDVMLPKLDGWQVCRELRQHSNVPVLMLTAREEEFDRVLGLSLGADDYVVKPFSPRELMARVKAILRRTAPGVPSPTAARVHGDLVLDPVKHKVTLGHRTIDLTGFEFKLLQTLISAPGRVFSREELLNRYYPDGEVVVDRVIDVHIGNLRRKIERNPGRPEYILTVRGFGYRFRETDEP